MAKAQTPGESVVAAIDEAQKPTGLALLRVPFPPHQISKLPKGGVMLDYVGHAALTDRLLDADPAWNWEPLALGPDGLPAVDANGGLWIRLTVCGQTRLGYGHAGAKKGGDAVKELIGDALRNAAMRFGAALDLWHKGDLHADEDKSDESPSQFQLDIEAAADTGTQALREAWTAATEAQRKTIGAKGLEALKARALKADGVAA